ncbi:hypothetical protein [Rhodoferax ferrireducens]|uniref:hypothetical protein n=1 Tax=Rhodoferax ferrireducens TaxID=192843 RepID=UPI003BB5995F
MESLKLIDVGDEVGIIFPEELCKRLQVGLGDEVHLTPTANGFSLQSNQSGTTVFFSRSSEPS